MLQKTNSPIAEYLEFASDAHERARLAFDTESRDFHQKMAERWMDLAANVAFVQRVDLYMRSLAFNKIPPIELCYDCSRRMRLITVEVTRQGEQHLFECPQCGNKLVRDQAL